MDSIPTMDQVEAIAALENPVLRNLQITQCYLELSAGLLRITGGNANWCTFAVWASKQAGQTIRKEDLQLILEGVLRTSPGPSQALGELVSALQRLRPERNPEQIRRSIWESFNFYQAIEQTSAAVARGNRKVFAEIAWQFARFYATCLPGGAPGGNFDDFCGSLAPGAPPDGQDYLAHAFSHLHEAILETDPHRQVELMLLSNIEIGFHEQTRLQPEIQSALDAPFLNETQFVQRLLKQLFPRSTALALQARALLMKLLGRPPALELAVRLLLSSAQVTLRQALTEMMLSIGLPGVRLRLWRDLQGEYPVLLRQITHPELARMLAQFDPTPDGPSGSGAVDWASLPERLHFILEFFRLYQQQEMIFSACFSPEQVREIKAGHIPQGRL